LLRTYTIEEAFEAPVRGSGLLTKAFIRSHPGENPVFSGSTTGPIGYLDTFDFEGQYLSWSTDGFAGRLMAHSGRFSGTTHRAFLKPKFKDLNLDYCRIVLAGTFREAARGRIGEGKFRNEYTALPLRAVSGLSFDVPVDETGALDVVAQADVVARWEKSRAFQKQAGQLISQLNRATVLPKQVEGGASKEVSLTDPAVFEFLHKETGWHKKDWVNLVREPGLYPVYSAAKAPVARVDILHAKLISASEDDPVLSFAVDGDGSAGTNFVVHETSFYVSTNRATLRPSDARVNVWFLYFALQTMKSDYGFGYSYKAYPSRLADVLVSIPVDSQGRFDEAAQDLEVRRLRSLTRLRDEVTGLLAQIQNATVTMF